MNGAMVGASLLAVWLKCVDRKAIGLSLRLGFQLVVLVRQEWIGFPCRVTTPLQLESIPGLIFAVIAMPLPSLLGFSASSCSAAAPKFTLFLGVLVVVVCCTGVPVAARRFVWSGLLWWSLGLHLSLF